jgi:hypothetical protein
LDAASFADGAAVRLDGRAGVGGSAQDSTFDRRSFRVERAHAARGLNLFERAVVVVERKERTREADARGGETRTKLKRAAVKLDGIPARAVGAD